MLHVSQIRLHEIRLPLKERFEISSGFVEERRILLLEMRHSDGVSVWSECVAGERPNYSPETIDTAWLALSEWLAPRVLGRAFDDPDEVAPFLSEQIRGHRMAIGALEMAYWALAATLEGVALADRVGGTRDRVPVGISLGIQSSPDRLAERATAAFADGYRKVKLKIRPGEDLTFVAAVREAVGPDGQLAVDANAAYTLEQTDRLARLDAFDLLMIEQPLRGGDLVRHAKLQSSLETPICLDESITALADVEDMVDLGSGRIVNIKPGRVGGFRESIAIHDYCQARGIPVWCGGMLESGVGRAYNVALASLPDFLFPGDLSPSRRYWERDVVTPEWTMDDEGYVTVPAHRPGIGVDVDRDRVEDLTVRHARLA